MPAAETAAIGKTGPLRVLVVDDDASQRILTQEMLRLLGHLSTTAEGTKQALEKLNTLRVDIVLTDIRMPRKTVFLWKPSVPNKIFL